MCDLENEEQQLDVTLVEIKLLKNNKRLYLVTEIKNLKPGQVCVVDNSGETELAEICCPPFNTKVCRHHTSRKVLHLATDENINQFEEQQQLEAEAHDLILQKIDELKLTMKFIKLAYAHDPRKMTFYFTADGRVDFRLLVRELARSLKMRIEMRQIGVRDEVKLVGALGPCGRECCCSAWIGKFEPVTIKMAKSQNLSLIPAKISGTCGRLLCCLKYEDELYCEARRLMPQIGDLVETPQGFGVVEKLEFLKLEVTIEDQEGRIFTEHASNVRVKKRNFVKKMKDGVDWSSLEKDDIEALKRLEKEES